MDLLRLQVPVSRHYRRVVNLDRDLLLSNLEDVVSSCSRSSVRSEHLVLSMNSIWGRVDIVRASVPNRHAAFIV